jgi:hypothetical protein
MVETLEESEMTEYVIRLPVGGGVVSVALATLGIAVYQHGAAYAALQT